MAMHTSAEGQATARKGLRLGGMALLVQEWPPLVLTKMTAASFWPAPTATQVVGVAQTAASWGPRSDDVMTGGPEGEGEGVVVAGEELVVAMGGVGVPQAARSRPRPASRKRRGSDFGMRTVDLQVSVGFHVHTRTKKSNPFSGQALPLQLSMPCRQSAVGVNHAMPRDAVAGCGQEVAHLTG